MSYDTDAQAYITAVESADTQALELGVKNAINAFVVGCKTDGIWSAIKASCIMAGARTLDGALTPLVGPAPTNAGGNFVSGDYDRKIGLLGNGASKYLDSNRTNDADGRNDNHNSVYVASMGSGAFLGTLLGGSGKNAILETSINNRGGATNTWTIPTGFVGTLGSSRNVSASFNTIIGDSVGFVTRSSQAPSPGNVFIYRESNDYGNHRMSFYSIGDSLDLELLDARLTTLMTALGDDATYSTLRRNHAFIGVAF
jgi:hypothetical protein